MQAQRPKPDSPRVKVEMRSIRPCTRAKARRAMLPGLHGLARYSCQECKAPKNRRSALNEVTFRVVCWTPTGAATRLHWNEVGQERRRCRARLLRADYASTSLPDFASVSKIHSYARCTTRFTIGRSSRPK